MIEQILSHIHNYFEYETHEGTFTIASGIIIPSYMQEGQYFRVKGSVFNDGVYKHPATGLHDEIFNGTIQLLAIPHQLIKITEEVEAWQAKNAEISQSPYNSESFGGYSYTKSSDDLSTWQGVFRSKLNPWRKIS